MNKVAIGVTTFVIGLGVGAAGGYFIAKGRMEYEIGQGVRERLGEALREMQNKKEETPKEDISEEGQKEPTPIKHHREEIGLKEAYNKMVKNEGYSNEEPESTGIFKIDEIEFGESRPDSNGDVLELDTMTLFYNPEMDILLSDEGEEVERPDIYVGDFNLREFFESEDDTDAVYFRDPDRGRDYEILLTAKGPGED